MPKKDSSDDEDEGYNPVYPEKMKHVQLVIGGEAHQNVRRDFTAEEMEDLRKMIGPPTKKMAAKWLFFLHELEFRTLGKATDTTQLLCDWAVAKGAKSQPRVMQQDVVRSIGLQVKSDAKTLPAVEKILKDYKVHGLLKAAQDVQLAALTVHMYASKPKKKNKVKAARATLNSYQNFKLAVGKGAAKTSGSSISGSDAEFEFEGEVKGDAKSDDDDVSTSSVLETESQASTKRKAAALERFKAAIKKRKAEVLKTRAGTAAAEEANKVDTTATVVKTQDKVPVAVPDTPAAGGTSKAGTTAPVTGTPGKKVTIGGQEYDESVALNLLQMFSAAAKEGVKTDQAAQDGAPVAPSDQVPPQGAPPGMMGSFATPQKGKRPCDFASLDPNHGMCDPLSGREVCGYATCDRCKGNGKPFAPYCSFFSKCGWKSCTICKGT